MQDIQHQVTRHRAPWANDCTCGREFRTPAALRTHHLAAEKRGETVDVLPSPAERAAARRAARRA